MADYIRREAAVSAILGEPTDAHYPEWYAQILMKLPAAEVAPVVHCWETDDDFCSYGERKDVG